MFILKKGTLTMDNNDLDNIKNLIEKNHSPKEALKIGLELVGLDIKKVYEIELTGKQMRNKDYCDISQIAEIMDAIKENGQIIEINTSAERRNGTNVFPVLYLMPFSLKISQAFSLSVKDSKTNVLEDLLSST